MTPASVTGRSIVREAAAGCGFECLRQPEIKHLYQTVRPELDIRGFQIAMNDPCSCAPIRALGDLTSDRYRIIDGNRTLRDAIGEGWPVDQLERESPDNAVVGSRGSRRLLETIDRRDVRMVERREDLRLPLEARNPIGIEPEKPRQDFECDIASESGIARAVHFTHPHRSRSARALRIRQLEARSGLTFFRRDRHRSPIRPAAESGTSKGFRPARAGPRADAACQHRTRIDRREIGTGARPEDRGRYDKRPRFSPSGSRSFPVRKLATASISDKGSRPPRVRPSYRRAVTFRSDFPHSCMTRCIRQGHHAPAASCCSSSCCSPGISTRSRPDAGGRSARLRDHRHSREALLHRDPTRVRQLLDAGEDPDQRDGQGFAPWMWAINFADNDALTLLLGRIPSIPATDAAGRRKLAMAASLNNLVAARALLDKGVPVDSPAIDGATPLLISAASGYVDLMKVLLAAGADPNRQDQHQDTPLMAAVRIGSRDAVKLLLDSRADPNKRDGSGRTAMHWAARSGRVDIVRTVLDAGARIDDIDETGRTPMTYAREKRHAAVIETLRRSSAKDTTAVTARLPLTPRDAVEKSLPLLVRGWRSWSERQSCGACHHRLMIDRVAALGRERGFAGASALVDDQLQFFTRNLASSEPRLRQQLASEAALLDSALGIAGDGSSGDALNLNVVLEIGVPGNAALEARALLLARKQLADGSWRTGLPRVPILSSDFTITAAAARTIAAYGGSHDAAEIADRVDRAKRWLIANRPVTTDDKASRLLGLRWTHADREPDQASSGSPEAGAERRWRLEPVAGREQRRLCHRHGAGGS